VEKEFLEKQCLKSGNVAVIAFETEVEEWATFSLRRNERDPSAYLEEHEKYEKSELSSKTDRLSFGRLKSLRSFARFVEALKDPSPAWVPS